MNTLGSRLALAGFLVLVAGSSAAHAQVCVDSVGEAGAPSREPALMQAYQAMLRAVDPALLQAWQSRSQKLGEAPGYTVRKLTTNCAARGAGQFCRISATLCRD